MNVTTYTGPLSEVLAHIEPHPEGYGAHRLRVAILTTAEGAWSASITPCSQKHHWRVETPGRLYSFAKGVERMRDRVEAHAPSPGDVTLTLYFYD